MRNASFRLRKRRKTWYALIYDPERYPKQIQRTLRTRDKSVARRKLVDWERQYADGQFDPWEDTKQSKTITVRECVRLFRKERRKVDSPVSMRTRGARFENFVEWADDAMPIKAVRARHIEAFLESLTGRFNDEPSIHTLATYYNTLAGLFSFAVNEGYVKSSPIEKVERPRAPEDDFTTLSVEEAWRVRTAILADTEPAPEGQKRNRRRLRRYMVGVMDMALASMLRISELCSLRWAQVRINDDRTAYVRVQNYEADRVEEGVDAFSTKTRTSKRTLFVPPRGVHVLQYLRAQYKEEHGAAPPPERIVFRSAWGKPLIPQTATRLWKEYVEMAGIDRRVRFHDLRHTGISWLLNDLDVPLVHVQEMAGHATPNRTMKYRRGGEQSMREAYMRAAGREHANTLQSQVRAFLWCEAPYELRSEALEVVPQ